MPANAQGGISGNGDLRAERLEIFTGDVANGVVNRTALVVLTVKNVGDTQFQGTTGWQVFLGWDPLNSGNRGEEEIDCIVSDAAVKANSECYQKIPVNDSRNTIGAGREVQIRFYWTPRALHATDRNVDTPLDAIVASIGTYGQSHQGGAGGFPPDGNADNNVVRFPTFIAKPAVRVVPDRDIADKPGAHINTAWDYEQVQADCKDSPEVTKTACRAEPEQLVMFAYRVENQGNSQDSFTGSIVERSGANLRSSGYKFTFSPPSITLQPGHNDTVRLLVEVPKNAPAHKGINVNFTNAFARWTSSLDPATNSNEDCSGNPAVSELGICQDPALTTMVIGVDHDMWIESNLTWAVINGGDTFTFNLTINNTGNFDDTFRVTWDREVSDINDSWSPQITQARRVSGQDLTPESGRIGAGQLENASISIRVPQNATRGVYILEVLAQSTQDADASPQNWTFRIEVLPRYDLSGGVLTNLFRVLPDQAATYNMYVTNNGNAVNNVTLRLENVPGGWERSISAERFSIPAFSSYPLTLTVRPPPNTKNDTRAAFYVNITSEDPRDKPQDQRARLSIETLMDILRGPNIRATVPVSSAFIDAGGTTTFDVRVTNTGNVQDNFTLVVPPGDRAWGVTTTPPYLLLNPLESGTFRLNVRAPQAAEVGETTKIFANVQSSVNPALVHPVNVTGRISGPDLFIDSIGLDTANPYAGDELEISVVLGNRGNKAPLGNATLRLEYVKEGVPTLVAADKIFPGSELGGGLRLTHRVLWNTSGIEGDIVLRARVDPDNSIKEIEEAASSNEATRPVTIRTLDLRVVQAQPLAGRAGELISYGDEPNVFLLEYRGNQDNEPVKIVLESENGWGRQEFDLGLKPFSPVALPIDIRIPLNPGVASDTLRLTVTPTLRPGGAVVSSVVTTVLDDTPPEFLDIQVTPDQAKLGEDIRFSARIASETGLREVRAMVVAPGAGDETTVLALADEGNGVWSVTRAFDFAGTYRYYLVAVDGSESANTNTTSDVVRTFRVTPSSAPQISLAPNQSATIRTGAPIQISIQDPLGIAKANYTILGITYDIPRPFDEIDTSSFSAGPVELVVTAENVYGAESSARFAFTVDNTPPTIRRVAVAPETPLVNEDVTLTIETDQETVSVDVSIKRDGQLVGTQKATRKQGNTWEVVFNPGEGENVIDVTAKDAAGNPKLMERAAVFTAKPAGFLGVPGFELVAALAAIGLALVLRRRRDDA